MGTCNEFIVLKNIGIKDNIDKTSNVIRKDDSLMFLEGCNPRLGCTICISGPEMKELIKIKSSLKEILFLARNLLLEKEFFVDFFIALNDDTAEQSNNSEDNEEQFIYVSPFSLQKFGLACSYLRRNLVITRTWTNTENTYSDEVDENDALFSSPERRETLFDVTFLIIFS